MKIFKFFLLVAILSTTELCGQSKMALIINGNDGSISNAEANSISNLLQANGYVVNYLTGMDANWLNVLDKAQHANILIYSGHGSTKGYNNTGGLCLNASNEFGVDIISSQILEGEIQLAQGALVIFKSVCGGAGSSASDESDIGLQEAKIRVSSYSYPFFKMGASAYFASNWSGDVVKVLNNLLNGLTLQESFEKAIGSWNEQEFIGEHQIDRSKTIGIASSYSPGTTTVTSNSYNGSSWSTRTESRDNFREFNLAFAGDSNYKLK